MNNDIETGSGVSKPVVHTRRGMPLIWLLPMVALVVSSWLIYKSILDKGPVITITFPTAEGLEVDKTKIKYKEVTVGNVTNIAFNEDLSGVSVTASMNKEMKGHLNKQTRFWVVKPHVGLTGITGLGTLLGGPYIEIEPGPGISQRIFTGLDKPPVVKGDVKGRHFTLNAESLGSLTSGSPVHFQGLRAGEVLGHTLSDDGRKISIQVFIEEPYDHFVRDGSRFWRDSGIHASVSADGIDIQTGSLESILGGGISFDMPNPEAIESQEGDTFALYADFNKTNEIIYSKKIQYVMYFDGSVRGLKPGAPVDLRGIQIGQVKSVQIQLASNLSEIQIPVVVELETDRVKAIGVDTATLTQTEEEIINDLIERGLRAQLQTGSLLTGQLFIEMDFYPDEKILKVAENLTALPEFPTIPTTLDQFSITAKAAVKRFSELPVEQIVSELSGTLMMLKTTLATTNKTMAAAKSTLQTADSALGTFKEGAVARYQLENTLTEMTGAARSIRVLTDYLERHPSSLVLGKPE